MNMRQISIFLKISKTFYAFCKICEPEIVFVLAFVASTKKTAQPTLHSRHGFLSSAWLTWHYLAVICCNSTPLHSTDATLHSAQLPGWLFSPSNVRKKLSQPISLYFPFGMNTYYLCSPCKINIKGCFCNLQLQENTFSQAFLLWMKKIDESVFLQIFKETPPDILRGGHKY